MARFAHAAVGNRRNSLLINMLIQTPLTAEVLFRPGFVSPLSGLEPYFIALPKAARPPGACLGLRLFAPLRALAASRLCSFAHA